MIASRDTSAAGAGPRRRPSDAEHLGVARDDPDRVLELVGEGGDEARAVVVDPAQLLGRLPLALGGTGVEDRPAQVLARRRGPPSSRRRSTRRCRPRGRWPACRAPRRRRRRARSPPRPTRAAASRATSSSRCAASRSSSPHTRVPSTSTTRWRAQQARAESWSAGCRGGSGDLHRGGRVHGQRLAEDVHGEHLRPGRRGAAPRRPRAAAPAGRAGWPPSGRPPGRRSRAGCRRRTPRARSW